MDIQTAKGISDLMCLVRDANIENCPLDEEFLGMFVCSKNFNIQAAFKTLKNYLRVRVKFSTLFPSSALEGLKCGMVTALKHRDPNGCKIFYFRTALWDTSKVDSDEAFAACTLILEEMITSKETLENGLIFIHDLKGLNLSHCTQLGPRQIQRILGIQGCSPVKVKGMHVINQPKVFSVLYALGYPFLSEKLRKRVHIYGKDIKSLYKCIPKEILPVSLGGLLEENKAIDYQLTYNLIQRESYYRNITNIICRNNNIS